MLFQNEFEDKSKVKLCCDYDEFDMSFVSLEDDYDEFDMTFVSPGREGMCYNKNGATLPHSNYTIKLKTTTKEYYGVLSKIMLNHSNTPLYFNLKIGNNSFQKGIIINIEECPSGRTVYDDSGGLLVTIKFNYRQEINYCEPYTK